MEKAGVFLPPAGAPVSSAPQPLMIGHVQRTAKAGEPPRHRVHEEHLLGLLLQGGGKYQVGPDELPMGEPVAWYLPAHEAEMIKLEGTIHGWWISFRWPDLEVELDGPEVTLSVGGLSHTTPRFKRVDPDRVPQMVELFQSLLAGAGALDLAGHSRARGLVQQLFGLYLEMPKQLATRTSHWAMEKFKHLLETRACENVSIEDLADEVQMSADHLRDLFHARFGRSPLEFRIALRLAMAKEMLCSSNLYIKEIAHRVGYPDPLYFSRVFRAHYGMSPRDVIRKFRRTAE